MAIIQRDGKNFTSVQIAYPIKNIEEQKAIPESLLQFDKSVKIRGI
ncbi:MAG: hypothetical protein WDO19_03225 [Bacteroidota bacterium]